jgi:dTDP-4-amino-4,6-dideoxygalactose transaminase
MSTPLRDDARTSRRVPFADLEPTTAEIREEVLAGWQRLLDSNRWVGGQDVEEFESSWARYCGTAEAVGVANGTDALNLALRALGIGAGDEVLLPANTFIATAEAVVLAGARPRFVDVDLGTLSMTPEAVEAAITPSTAALVPVHLYGHVADLPALGRIARRHGLAVLEDAAQAHGATRDGVTAGSLGDAAGFSFYPGKNLGAFGDGGAMTTDDTALAARVRSLANHGRSDTDRYVHPHVGTNSRLDALQAVVLSAKLARLDEWTARRRRIVDAYRERVAGLPLRLVEPDAGVTSAWHLLVVRVAERDRVRADLAARGVETGIHYPVPCHEQDAYLQWAGDGCPVASRSARELLSLPLHPHMALDDVEYVCEALAAVLDPEDPVGDGS